MNTDQVDVHVEINGLPVLAGTAHFTFRRGALSTTFTYDPAYMRNPEAYDLSPDLAIVNGTHHVPDLPRAFSDSAPDRWGRGLIKQRLRQEGLRRDLTEVDFLLNVADRTRQGALRFCDPGTTKWLHPYSDIPRTIELPKLLRASEAVAQGSDDYEAIKAILNADTAALGGARPKASVVDGDRLMIAKFGHPDDQWDVMAWEKTALDLAELAGLPVPGRRLESIDGRHVLILDRFDRGEDSRRIGYISALTLMGLNDGDHGEYIDLAEEVAERAAQPGADRQLRDLFARIVFGLAINNVDDHLRNHGLLRDHGGWVLAPVFDVNPLPETKNKHTSVAGATERTDALTSLLEEHQTFGLTRDEACSVIGRVEQATARWREVAHTNGARAAEISQFEDAFEGIRDLLRSLAGPSTSTAAT